MSYGLWFGDSHLGFGTHMPILAAVALAARPGPILEYGAGLYSTTLLHTICEETARELLTLDSDAGWLARFEGMAREWHTLRAFADWTASEPLVDAREWSVAFVDHGPEERRVIDIRRLANRAEFVVVHDWGPTPEQAEVAALYRYSYVSRVGPLSAVLSNVRPFSL